MQEQVLSGFVEGESSALLSQWGVQANVRDRGKAWQLCQGHPFALALLDRLLRSRHITLATLLNEPVYQRLWINDVELALFKDLYEPLDELARTILQAFAMYRNAVSVSSRWKIS